jgi:glycosyltransferase involved in cell wall biosynthesis
MSNIIAEHFTSYNLGLTMKIVYCSPYYDPAVPSGANRRFDEVCRRLERDFGDDFTLIVAKGKQPTWWQGKNLVEVDYRFNHRSKFGALREIEKVLDDLPPSVVIMESVPIPFRALKRHTHFQCVYDFRYFYSFSKSFWYRLFFSAYLKHEWRRSQYIVTCSEFSISELKRFVGVPRERVVKSFFGINQQIFSVPHRPLVEKDYDLIYVGHFDGHKNHAPLIEALTLMRTKPKTLFIGVDNGKLASLHEQVAHLGLEKDVEFKTVKNEKEVWDCYTRSKVFVSPSLYEGFGMPTIEALALGLPVALSDIEVFHEVGGDLAVYFDPHDPKSIASTLTKLLTNPNPPEVKVVREHLEQFTWDKIYEKFILDLKAHSSEIK